jgi:hypothetical protein
MMADEGRDLRASLGCGAVSGRKAVSLTRTELREELEAQRKRRIDPYRMHLQFLTGLIGFCLAVIVAVLAALPKSEAPSFNLTIGGGSAAASGGATASVTVAALGGILAWIAIAALVATFAAFIVQVARCWRAVKERDQATPPPINAYCITALWVVAWVPILPGAGAVIYCVRGGSALLNGASALAGFWPALRTLF